MVNVKRLGNGTWVLLRDGSYATLADNAQKTAFIFSGRLSRYVLIPDKGIRSALIGDEWTAVDYSPEVIERPALNRQAGEGVGIAFHHLMRESSGR